MRWARRLSLVLGVVCLLLIALGTSLYYDHLIRICFQSDCQLGLVAAPSEAEIAAVGLPLAVYVSLVVAIELGYAAVYFAVAGTLFWRARDNRVALLGAIFLAAWGTSFSNIPAALASAYPAWQVPVGLVGSVALIAIFAFFSLFPSGQFVPRHMKLLLVAWIAYSLVLQFSDNQPVTDNIFLLFAIVVSFLGFMASMVLAQWYRYLRASSTAQRQQTKWVVYGAAVGIVSLIALMWIGATVSPLPEPRALTSLLHHAALHVSTLAIPLSIMMAILSSRLWSIDIIIRRTLIYTALTGALAGFYLVSIFVLQLVFQTLTGQARSELVTVVSTLAIAAVFFPLRAGVQAWIDRRFYRRKYDAALTVAALGVTLRDEVDLETLVCHLVQAADDTLQPAHAALWLKGTEKGRPGSYDETDRR
jgi:hypothetical protein